ncbi:hypothetical protein A4244_08290 [Bacillus badius]|nr:hypothetical protein A4244_08290 [Bacillus badius]OCS84020.1 hypothetical protein A6M11_08305 [Bacillus badius]
MLQLFYHYLWSAVPVKPAPKKESFKNCTELRKNIQRVQQKDTQPMIQSTIVIKTAGLVSDNTSHSKKN